MELENSDLETRGTILCRQVKNKDADQRESFLMTLLIYILPVSWSTHTIRMFFIHLYNKIKVRTISS